MQCNSIPQKTTHQFEMSSSSSSSSSSVSYSYGIPGSQVTLTLNKSGNHSATLSRGNSKTSSSVPVPAGQRRFPDGFVGAADMPFCKVCYDAGLPVAYYTDHFVKDQPGPNGKVVCPTLLAQKCLTCGLHGHTSSYCPGTIRHEQGRVGCEREEREKSKKANGGWETVGSKGTASSSSISSKPRIEDMAPKKSANLKPEHQRGAAATSTKYGSFGALAVDDSSDSEEEHDDVAQLPVGVPKPVRKEAVVVTGPPPAVAPPKPLTWAQRAAAAAQKPSPPSSSSSVAAPLNDTRFQLHAMCDNIEQSKRASAPKKVNHVAETANIRGAAAAIASESSKKRKQNSAMIPA